MADENPSANQANNSLDGNPEVQAPESINSPEATEPGTNNEFQEVKKELSDFEKATLTWTRVIVGINALTLLFIGLQWYEIRTGSVDTHALAVAAGQQAVAATTQSQQAIAQTKNMSESLSKTDALIAATNKLAAQAKIQSDVMQIQSENQRPWIEVEGKEPKKWENGADPKSFILTLTFVVRNTGVSAARIVNNPRFVIGDLTKPEDRFWKEDLCVPTQDQFRFYDPLFENAENEIGAEAVKPLGAEEPGRLDNYLSGCIVYYGPTGGPHKLRLIYFIEYAPEMTMETNKLGYHKIKSIELVRTRTDAYHGDPH